MASKKIPGFFLEIKSNVDLDLGIFRSRFSVLSESSDKPTLST